MRSRHRRFIGGMALAMAAMALTLVLWPTARASAEGDENLTVYVSAMGDDESDGSAGSPYATLAHAVSMAENGGTIKLLSDLTSTKYAFIDKKSVTINGGGYTVTRGDTFDQHNDARGGYNPAMIEVANGSTLTLVDITLDDGLKTMGSNFLEQKTGDGDKNNENKVQDAIIAAYHNGGTIVLGNRAVLKNFGGMSAVRIGGQPNDPHTSTLIMQSGSKIVDKKYLSRQGGVAAIWSQGGKIEMQAGSEISDIDGRAIFLEDGGIATVCGTITGITANSFMTFNPEKGTDLGGGAQDGFAGIAVAARGNSSFTLGENGKISNINSDENKAGDVAVMLENSSFATTKDAAITEIRTVGLIENNQGKIEIGGTVSNCSSNNVLFRLRGGTEVTFKLAEGARITKCSTNDVGGLVYLNGGKPDIEIAGTIDGFNKPALYISINGTRPDGSVTLTETGEITGITGDAIKASDPSTVTIAGEISNCTGYAVKYNPKSTGSLLNIEPTAVIQSNNSGKAQICVDGSLPATDSQEHVKIARGATLSNRTIDLTPFDVTLDESYDAIKLGNASADARGELSSLVSSEHSDWTTSGSALWFQPSGGTVHFVASRPSTAKKTGLYAAYIPLNADGTPTENAEATLVPVSNEPLIDVSLNNLTAGQSYALMFVNNKEYTLRPDDITIYTGGGQGDEIYDNGGLPKLSLNNCIDKISDNTEVLIDGRSVGGNAATKMQAVTDLFTVTYTDQDENIITDDKAPGEYTATLRWANGTSNTIKIGDNDVNNSFKTGKLIIRHTADQDEAEKGTNTYPLLTIEPTEAVTNTVAIAKKSGGSDPEFYINDDINRQIADTDGISILDDSLLLEHENDNRQQLLEKKAIADNNILGPAPEYKTYAFDFHYLDLVDTYNGNAWVSASYGTTVYLPYPAGTNASTDFTLVHYKDLHREYGISDQADVEEAIEACELEIKTVEKTDYGIRFEVDKSGFSPFALVWEVDACTITASAGEGGTITPNGDVKVAKGSDQTFTIEASEGYQISDVKVDGVSGGAVDEYTFKSVTKNHAISATFAKKFNPPGSTYYHIDASAGTHGSISPSGRVSVASGSSKTFTFAPEEGYEVATVTVDGTPVGAASSYTFNNVTADHKIAVTFQDKSGITNPDDTGVSDVLDTKHHIAYLHGYANGTGAFGTTEPMTRAEAAAMFYNLLRKQDVTITKSFADVPSDAWYHDAVCTMATLGYIKGVGDGKYFEPNRSITRAEFTAIAMRFAHMPEGGSNPFTDVPEDAWYRDVVVGAVAYGWINGYNDHTFGPNDTLQRAQAAAITNHLLGRVPDEHFIGAWASHLKSFVDIAAGHWAYLEVMEATNGHEYTSLGSDETWIRLAADQRIATPAETGIDAVLNARDHIAFLHGVGDGATFMPDIAMTRAEAAAMFYNLLLKQDVAITASFEDVPEDAWYHDAVCAMATLGYIKGTGDGTRFEPNRYITRAEFAALATRFASTEAPSTGVAFEDVPAGAWYASAVRAASTWGWISGYNATTFGPNDNLTRAQAATIANRMLGRKADWTFIDAHASQIKDFADVDDSHWAYFEIVEATNAHEHKVENDAEVWANLR